jgi:hypothetical protein
MDLPRLAVFTPRRTDKAARACQGLQSHLASSHRKKTASKSGQDGQVGLAVLRPVIKAASIRID